MENRLEEDLGQPLLISYLGLFFNAADQIILCLYTSRAQDQLYYWPAPPHKPHPPSLHHLYDFTTSGGSFLIYNSKIYAFNARPSCTLIPALSPFRNETSVAISHFMAMNSCGWRSPAEKLRGWGFTGHKTSTSQTGATVGGFLFHLHINNSPFK